MPLNRSAIAATATPNPRRTRPVGPTCRGGASSLLRLAQPAVARMPQPRALSDWMERSSAVLLPVTGPLAALPARAAWTR